MSITGTKKISNLKLISVFFVLCVFSVLLAIYVGNVIFGDRSFVVLKNLRDKKNFLIKDNKRLKDENAKLQKQYLERALLDPDLSEFVK
ncbi:hypothetical protein F1B92_01595 [Campylobacter sp. FMV-PI01]|uniref:Septum formation initiator n=1 Tax=Campylobacter portucalensis TaxID=2608384 RepID=A0A6L5WG50_9BACT|nr:hypothetical protein [Campylobacter portucalensis]MSN95899.1 hypothetical protein [Campylobacter portucalensis]